MPSIPQGSANTEHTAENSPQHSPDMAAGLKVSALPWGPGLPTRRGRSGAQPTCTGVPGLNEPPDNGVALVTGLLDTFALLLVETVLEEDSDVGLVLVGVLERPDR